ncbi:TetR/AcrR family transcriptional regulator [uncultured Parabacteroides sp.]|uniref:TetR/AcrR family transcriptional regulator n=1 Tax=uncultured Parabacteroides sp. TaxID=512312 RepID=UPI00259289DD|nr:TetR/AcrR family transcriptional regulator [uncultured Parabacteroides sp.]
MEKIRRYSKSEKTMQYIIEQVAPIFNKKGYVGTSLSDLTEATGLTKGCIYGIFKNKDEVAIEAFKYNLAIITDSFFKEISDNRISPLDKLLLLPKTYLKRYDNIVIMGGCPILNTAVDADDTHPELKKMAQNIVSRINKSLALVIEEGISKEQIKPETNPDKVAEIMISLVEGGFMMAKLLDNKEYFENSLEQLNEIINGLRI